MTGAATCAGTFMCQDESVLVGTWAMTGTRIRTAPSICYLLVHGAKRALCTISRARDEVGDTWIDSIDRYKQHP